MNQLTTAILIALAFVTTANAQSTVTANIHNAPGWEPSTTYTYHAGPPSGHFMRVNAGPGWTPSGGTGGTYNSGLTLNDYQLISTAQCTSAVSGTGPSGTGSSISDGTIGVGYGPCTWKYVGPVDYVTFTGWALDNGKIWASSTNYGYMDVVHTTDPNLPVFMQVTAGCSSTVKPTTSNFGTMLSDGCFWDGSPLPLLYGGQQYIYYSSNANTMPMSTMNRTTFQGSISGRTLCVTTPPATIPVAVNQYINYPGTPNPQTAWGPNHGIKITASGGTCRSGTPWTVNTNVTAPYSGTFFAADEESGIIGTSYQFNVGLLWNDREYVSGQNGEGAPIQSWGHNYHYNDSIPYTLRPPTSVLNAGYIWGYPTTIKPAPGEGFQDTYAANPSLPLAGYNTNYGVGLRGVGVEGFGPSDNSQVVTGLQITSDTQPAIVMEQRAGNAENIHRNILEGGTGAAFVGSSGAMTYWHNNLIVAHGTLGIQLDYGGFVYNNTIVCPDGKSCQSAIDNTVDWVNKSGTVINGNLVFGFQHFTSSNFYNNQDDWHTCTWNCVSFQGTNNATDVPSTDGVGFENCTLRSACAGISFANSGSAVGVTGYAVPFQTGAASEYFSSGTNVNRNVWICGTIVGSPDAAPIKATCGITNSVSPSSVFAAWPGNYKILDTSVAYGKGASYAPFSSFPYTGWPSKNLEFCSGTWAGCADDPNTPDLFGNTRPTSGRYDIGAVQYGGTPAPPVITRGKLIR